MTQPSSIAAWPTTTFSPTIVGRSWAQWMTALSCTDAPGPMWMLELSPRSTAPNQMLALSPTRTSPTRTAVGASQTSRPMVGDTPSSSISSAALDDMQARLYVVGRPSSVTCRDDADHRGAGSAVRKQVARAPPGGQERRGLAAPVARGPAVDPAEPHRLGRHRAHQRARLPARRPPRARPEQLRLGGLDHPRRAGARAHRLSAPRRPR